jgi:predicted O-methyltransferase YrrM
VLQQLFQLKTFISYWLDAVDAHSLHSPFVFDFYTKVAKGKNCLSEDSSLKQIRTKLLSDHRVIGVEDLGAGSTRLKKSARKISDIAATSLTPEKFSNLYNRIIKYYRCQHIVELGTSLGINSLYLAHAHDKCNVTTFEGSPPVSAIAKEIFQLARSKNIKLIEGNIDETLPVFIRSSEAIDFAFMDANHRFEPTLRYFELLIKKIHLNSIIIVDDIHYSEEMNSAWRDIQTHERVFCTLDLYRCGIVFFNPALNKQTFVLQF